jgi:hypothetical protein
MEEWQFVAACGRMVASGDKEAGIEPASAAKRSKRPRERFLFRFFLHALQLQNTILSMKMYEDLP